MRRLAVIVFVLGFLSQVCRADVQTDVVTVQSRSGLFTIHGPSAPLKSLYFNNFVGNRPLVLDPALLAVSCEQIKELLFAELGYNVRQQMASGKQNLGLGKIFLVLHEKADEPIAFSAIPATGGLSYRVDLPNEMFASRMIETIVQMLILDMANLRNNGPTVSPPIWLTDGLVHHLQSVGLETLPLEANLPVTKVKVRKEPAAQIRENLHEQIPLTFDELSWPEKLSPERAAVFEDSAQLLVYQLLRLKDGRACMRKMIGSLPRYKNWQFAFLHAFQPHFAEVIDVEKWWALTLVSFTGRDPMQIWSREESEKKLNAALKVPAQMYTAQNAMPQRTDLNLQRVVKEWDYTRQQLALQKTVAQLRTLRFRIAPELLPIVDDYRKTLETYLLTRRPGKPQEKNSVNATTLQKATAKRLDELDKQYSALSKKSAVPTPPAKQPKPAVSSASAK